MNAPTITFQDGKVHGHKWLCFIDEGPGHSGLGDTQAEALINAGIGWYWYEDKLKTKHNPGNKFYLRKNGYYFRPRARGYTSSHMEAGLFSQEEAESYVAHSEGVTMHQVEDHGSPDEIEIYRAIKASGARKHADIAKTIAKLVKLKEQG